MDKDFSDMMSRFSDMMGNLGTNSSFNNASSNNVNQDNSSFNFDINTFIKLKSVMDKMNSTPDPRGNLLKSLKPYLRKPRQEKIDQYINLFSMGKVMEALRQTGGDIK